MLTFTHSHDYSREKIQVRQQLETGNTVDVLLTDDASGDHTRHLNAALVINRALQAHLRKSGDGDNTDGRSRIYAP